MHCPKCGRIMHRNLGHISKPEVYTCTGAISRLSNTPGVRGELIECGCKVSMEVHILGVK